MSNPEFKCVSVRPCIKCGAIDRGNQGQCNICNRAKASAWYAKNAERAKTNGMVYRAANPEKHKAAVLRVRASNPEKIKATHDAWRAANPEIVRLSRVNREARKRGGGGVLSKGLAKKLLSLQKGMCPCCRQPLGDDYHLDHIQPLVLGGSNTDDNIQLLRATCNHQKHAKHPVDFMQERGYLL